MNYLGKIIPNFNKANKHEKNRLMQEMLDFFDKNESLFLQNKGKIINLKKTKIFKDSSINFLDNIIKNQNIKFLNALLENNQIKITIGENFSEDDIVEIKRNIGNSFHKLYTEVYINKKPPYTIELHNYDTNELNVFLWDLGNNSLDIFTDKDEIKKRKEDIKNEVYCISYDYKNFTTPTQNGVAESFVSQMQILGYNCGCK